MSHPNKRGHSQFTIKTTKKRSQTICDEKSRSSCIHVLLLLPGPRNITLVRNYVLLFLIISQSEKPVQRRLQNIENNEGSHQRIKEWHSRWTWNVCRNKMYSIRFGNDVICCGSENWCSNSPLYHETQLKSALGLRSMNADWARELKRVQKWWRKKRNHKSCQQNIENKWESITQNLPVLNAIGARDTTVNCPYKAHPCQSAEIILSRAINKIRTAKKSLQKLQSGLLRRIAMKNQTTNSFSSVMWYQLINEWNHATLLLKGLTTGTR